MQNILFITNDVIGDSTAGPGIRYRELGAALARRGHRVTVMGRSPSFATPQPFVPVNLSALNIIKHVRRNDCVVFRGGGPLTTLLLMLFARHTDLISDIYAFTQFEVQQIIPRGFRERLLTDLRKRFHVLKMRLYGNFCRHFWVANTRQLHFLQGMFYGIDASPESRTITVVPFGYPSAPPERTREAVRGVIAGISRGDFLIIWGAAYGTGSTRSRSSMLWREYGTRSRASRCCSSGSRRHRAAFQLGVSSWCGRRATWVC